MDLAALANNLGPIAQQLAPLAGALAGHGSGAGRAGALAAIGDYHHEQNQRTYEGVKQFSDMLEKIGMDTENWTEEARNAAMHERLNLLSPKTISKIYSNPTAADKIMGSAWENIRQASARPVDTQAQATEKNAAAGRIPALGQAGTQAGDIGAAMSGVGAATGNPALGLLGPALSSIPAATEQAANQNRQTLATPGQATRYGPLSPGEIATRHLQALKPMMDMWNAGGGAGGGGGGLTPLWGMDAKGHPTMHMRVDTSRPVMLQPIEGSAFEPGYWDAARQSYILTRTGQPVNPVSFMPSDRPVQMTGTDAQGNPTKTLVKPSAVIGQPQRQPVRMTPFRQTDENGNVTIRPWQPYTGKAGAPQAAGTVPFAGLKAAGMRYQNMSRQAALAMDPGELDMLIDQENSGADVTKINPTTYSRMMQRRNDLVQQGDTAHGNLPKRYTGVAAQTIGTSVKVLNEMDSLEVLAQKVSGGHPDNIPYKDALNVLAYNFGMNSGDDLGRYIAEASIDALNSGASVGGKIRNWQYIQKQLAHTPVVGKDSMQLILEKIKAIRTVNEATIAAQRDVGLKTGVVTFPGQKPVKPLTTTPRAPKPQTTPPKSSNAEIMRQMIETLQKAGVAPAPPH